MYSISKVEEGEKPNEHRVTIEKDGIDLGVVIIKSTSIIPEAGCADIVPEHLDKEL